MSKRLGAVACAAAVAVALTPAEARADKVITAQALWHFDAMSYTIAQGEKLTFDNEDSQSPGPHNVTSLQNGPDGSPLFHSGTIKYRQQSVVDGAQQLKPGSYTFECTIHTFMRATLQVTSSGAAPAPAPSGGSSSAPADTTKPKVHAVLRRASLRSILHAGAVRARITAGERVRLRLELVARLGGRTVTLAQRTTTDRAPNRATDFSAKLTAAGRRALRSRRRLAVTLLVAATDRSGNTTTTRTRRTLRR